MAYNAESMALTGAVPQSGWLSGVGNYGQGYAYSGSGMPSWEQPQAPASTPGSFNSTYGGGGWSPRDTNIEDYWTGSGYSEIGASKEYQPYNYSNTYQYGNLPTDTWSNANTYAPWSGYGPSGNESTPGELNQFTNINNGYYGGGDSTIGNNWQAGAAGAGVGMGTGAGLYGAAGLASGGVPGMAGLMSAGVLGPAGLIGGGLMMGANALGAFDRKKKRSSPEFNAPSYQGMMFTPEEGFPSYYSPSQTTQNQTQQEVYDQSPYYEQPGATQGYDYNYTGGQNSGSLGTPTNPQQDFVGQQEDAYGSFYNPNRGGIYETFTV